MFDRILFVRNEFQSEVPAARFFVFFKNKLYSRKNVNTFTEKEFWTYKEVPRSFNSPHKRPQTGFKVIFVKHFTRSTVTRMDRKAP